MRITKLTTAAWCVASLLACSNAVLAASDQSDMSVNAWYIGGGLGISELDPETGNSGYKVSDKRDTGIKLFAGYDFTEKFTAELFYTDLGAAKLSSEFVTLPDGEISYSTVGASALWYFWRNTDAGSGNPRKGLQAYIHGGLSFLNNSATSDIKYSKDNSTQISYGAALEYGFENGYSVRAGLDLYDKDAGIALVSVLKRFGVKTASKPRVVKEPEPEPVIEVLPEEKPVVVAPVVIPDVDTDQDGVIDRLDDCSESPKQFSVDEKGCSIISLNFAGVNFESNAYELTEESKKHLDEVAITINLSPEIQHKIEVSAHTDYKGSGSSNLALSEKRAQAVKDYLVLRGVNEKRLVAKGYGESQPIASNKTAEGRAKNRRVEIKVIKDETVGGKKIGDQSGDQTSDKPPVKSPETPAEKQ